MHLFGVHRVRLSRVGVIHRCTICGKIIKQKKPVKLYKLTDQDGYTRRGECNETLWGDGVSHTATGSGTKLCSAEVIHAYRSPEEAVFYNPIHADISAPIGWESRGVVVADDGTKVGVKTMTALRRIELPTITTETRIRIGIRCAMLVYRNPDWTKWAERWLSGEDRSLSAAAYAAAADAASAFAAYAAARAADAAYAAARAAYAAARAAAAARADKKTWSKIRKIIREEVKNQKEV
jgi:hypothetical protein